MNEIVVALITGGITLIGVLISNQKSQAVTDTKLEELTPAEQRERAYNSDPVIPWNGSMLTVTEAAQQWAYYAAEGNTAKTDAITALIAAAKEKIRAQYPDEEGGA